MYSEFIPLINNVKPGEGKRIVIEGNIQQISIGYEKKGESEEEEKSGFKGQI